MPSCPVRSRASSASPSSLKTLSANIRKDTPPRRPRTSPRSPTLPAKRGGRGNAASATEEHPSPRGEGGRVKRPGGAKLRASLRENLHRLLVQARIAGGEDAAASARVAALPGRDHAASALDDRAQRHDVEILEPRLDHEVDLAESEQAVIVAVAAEAPEAHGTGERGKAGLLLFGLEQVRARGGEQSFAQARARPGVDRLLYAARMAEIALPFPAPVALAGEGLVHQAEQRAALAHKPDQRPPQGLADDEGSGPVDRIDDPAIVGVGRGRSELLPDNAMGRVGRGERIPDGGLGGEVGGGDRIEQGAAFVVNREGCPEMRQYDRTGPVGEGVRGGEKIVEIGVGGHGVPFEAASCWLKIGPLQGI